MKPLASILIVVFSAAAFSLYQYVEIQNEIASFKSDEREQNAMLMKMERDRHQARQQELQQKIKKREMLEAAQSAQKKKEIDAEEQRKNERIAKAKLFTQGLSLDFEGVFYSCELVLSNYQPDGPTAIVVFKGPELIAKQRHGYEIGSVN